MIPTELRYLANHLWQSTMFAAAVGLISVALRNHHAHVRYWLWLTASLKFLVPFAILVEIGSHWGRHAAAAVAPAGLSSVMLQVSVPFAASDSLASLAPTAPSANPVPAILFLVWAIGFTTLAVSRWLRWRRIRAALATASPVPLAPGLDGMTSSAFAEPAVFGLLRPIVLLPTGVTQHLTPPQWEAILAHERCHMRRRDNLTGALHMAVEALFWFYPLVWWLGARLIAERERACDEEVLLRNEPQAYAEGILRICELYLESRLACVAGVTGGNLRKRIEAVMSHRVALSLNFRQKAALAAAGVTALVAPLVVGVINAPVVLAQIQQSPKMSLEFEVASIKAIPDSLGWPPRAKYWVLPRMVDPQRFRALIQVSRVIEWAYGVRDFQVQGGPAWIKEGASRFEIQATAGEPSSLDQMRQMAQTLLRDRFKLKLHRETREIPLYALVIGRSGPRITAAEASTFNEGNGAIDVGQGILKARATMMAPFVEVLTDNLDRPVIDQTNLTGHYDFTLYYDQSSLSDWRLGPVLFSLVQDLGLRLEPQKGLVEILVIDSVDRPSEN